MMSVFAVLEPRFLDPTNLFNVMRQISITGLIALGMTFVILTAGIDLSVGSMLALAGIIAAATAKGSPATLCRSIRTRRPAMVGSPRCRSGSASAFCCGFIQGPRSPASRCRLSW